MNYSTPSSIFSKTSALRSWTIGLCLAFVGTLSLHSAVQLPVRIFVEDATAVSTISTVNVPGGANPADTLYLKIHNVRAGGQVSVAVNAGAWHDIHNHNVTFKNSDGKGSNDLRERPVCLVCHSSGYSTLIVNGLDYFRNFSVQIDGRRE